MMSQLLLEEVQCPICIETLKKPIRILPCGHNLCQICLEDLCRSEQRQNCPTCRNALQLHSNGIEELPRNHVVENMIDMYLENSNQVYKGNSLENQFLDKADYLKELAESYMNENKFENAAEILHILIKHSDGLSTVKPSIQRAKCLLETGNVKEAKNVYYDLISIIDSSDLVAEMKEIFDEFDDEIGEAAEIFVEMKKYELATGLCRILNKIISYFYEGETKLLKLSKLGKIIEAITVKMKGNYKHRNQQMKPIVVTGRFVKDLVLLKKNRKRRFKKQLQMLKEILDEMQSITEVDMKLKCLEVASILRCIEFCSHNVGFFSSYQMSVEISKQAIAIVQTAFGAEACQFKVIALCYSDLGCALKYLRRNKEAKSALKKAIETHNVANDWLNEDEKSDSLLFTIKELQKIDKTTEYQNEELDLSL